MAIWTRPFNPADAPALVAMVREAFDEPYPDNVWAQLAGYWPEAVIMALDDAETVGALVGVRDSEKTARVLILVVAPPYRGRGIGARLLSRFMHACKALGLEMVTLEVRKSNVRARAFYERHGFTVVCELPCFYTSGEDAWQMAAIV